MHDSRIRNYAKLISKTNGARMTESTAEDLDIHLEGADQVPFVDYLVLGDEPHLEASECLECGARFFDRRNACAKCFNSKFKKVRVDQTGEVTSFTIVEMGPQPYVSAIVDCGGTHVRCTLIGVEPSPEAVHLGMKVGLKTYLMGTDSEGTEAIAFGFTPVGK